MPRFKDFWVGKHMEVLGGGKFQKDFKTVPVFHSTHLFQCTVYKATLSCNKPVVF